MLVAHAGLPTSRELSLQPAKATFISEVEVIRSEMLESEVVVEGEYASVETMRSWGFSECLSSM